MSLNLEIPGTRDRDHTLSHSSENDSVLYFDLSVGVMQLLTRSGNLATITASSIHNPAPRMEPSPTLIVTFRLQLSSRSVLTVFGYLPAKALSRAF
jgi:hypothetical protein